MGLSAQQLPAAHTCGAGTGTRSAQVQRPNDDSATRCRALRLVVLNTEFHTGGAESVTARVFTALAQRGHTVDWCALYRPGPTGELLAAAGQAVASGFMRGRADWIGFVRVAAWMRKLRPDVVWFIAQPATVFWAQLAARVAGARCVAAVHNSIDFRALAWYHPYRWLLRPIDRIVCVADCQRRDLIAAGKLLPGRVCRIYNGVDSHRAAPAQRLRARQALLIGDGEIVAGMVARLYPVKGVDIFIQAARLCIAHDPRLRFVVVGDGPQAAAVRKLVSDSGLRDRVLLLGHRDDVQEILPAFDIGVLSSRSEALPMGVLEYMAAGLPVIAAEVGSLEELVIPECTGLLIAPGAPEKLAEAILRLAREPQTRVAWGEQGRRRAQQFFSVENTVRETESLCSSLGLAQKVGSL